MCAEKERAMTTTEKLVEATNRLADIVEASLKERHRSRDAEFIMGDQWPPEAVYAGKTEQTIFTHMEDKASLSATVDGLVMETNMIGESISFIGNKLGVSFVSPTDKPTVPSNVVELLEDVRERLNTIREFLPRIANRIG